MFLALVIAIITIARPVAAQAQPDRPPNIVIFFIDDLGYADIGPFGATRYATPRLDRMAREGRRFTDFYVAQAVCSASRAALLTGCYNGRVSIQGALFPGSKKGLHPDETTLAEVCKSRGYATACFGKWHLGDHPSFLPTRQGFDTYLGLPYSNDMWPYPAGEEGNAAKRKAGYPELPLIEGDRVINPEVTARDQAQLTTLYTQRAVRFIQENREKPFFIYIPHTMVHIPLYVSDRFKGKSGAGLYGDCVQEIDWSVGEVLDTLQKLQLDENTLVMFTSDNGPWLPFGEHGGSAGPLREGKGSTFEGGVRVPMLARWPRQVPAGTTCSEPAMTIDLLPTIAKLIGAPLPPRPIDGKDIGPLLRGEADAKSPHEALFFYWHAELQAVRMGPWKLHYPHKYSSMANRPGGKGGKPAASAPAQIEESLFNLHDDLGETRDIKAQHPDVVQRIHQLADAMRAQLGDSARKMPPQAARPVGEVK
jgi:arylsulfatase A-like enzyme